MNCKGLYNQIEKNKNDENSVKMAAYMRNQFPFLGVRPPERKVICKDFFKLSKKEGTVDWEFIDSCWENKYREMQYVAIDYLAAMQKFLMPKDVPKIKHLASVKSWWDTIDGLDKIAGNIAINYPEVNDILIQWSIDDNFWIRRIAIDHQLLRKDRTNTKLLEIIICNNFGSNEFFINKAIGWSLRDYSKTNPEWVKCFVERYRDKLAPLSIKEASKYI